MKSERRKSSIITQAAAMLVLASMFIGNAMAVTTFRTDTIRVNTVSPITAKFTTDLTQLGREGRLVEDLSYESEMIRLMSVLAEGGVRQPVIVDEAKQTQNNIVEQLALRIANGSAPRALLGRTVLKLDADAVFSNAATAEELDSMLAAIIKDAASSKGGVILFIDDLPSVVLRGEPTGLTAALAEGKIAVIGGSSAGEYADRIEADAEIAGYFSGILVADRARSSASATAAAAKSDEGYRGDNVSPDLRDMMQKDPSGKTRIDVILQAKNADNPALRAVRIRTGQDQGSYRHV